MNLLIALRAELLKTKRTASLYCFLLTAAAIPLMFFVDFYTTGVNENTIKNPWNAFFMSGMQGLSFVLLPMYVILICTLIPQIEYRNNTWKQALASPQSLSNIFLSKFLMVQFFILLLFVFFNLFMFLAAAVIHFMDPDLRIFEKGADWKKLLLFNFRAYMAILVVSVIQFWIGIRLKNFIAPIAIGFALWMAGGIMLFEFKSVHADKFPYAYTMFTILPRYEASQPSLQLYSLAYAVLFLVLGLLHFNMRKIK